MDSKYYLPFGNSRPENYSTRIPTESIKHSLSFLLLDSSDLKSVCNTLSFNPNTLHFFTLRDDCAEVIARDIVFIYAARFHASMKLNIACMWQLWFSVSIEQRYLSRLESILEALIESAVSLEHWNDNSQIGKLVKIRDHQTFEKLKMIWEFWRNVDGQNIPDLQQTRMQRLEYLNQQCFMQKNISFDALLHAASSIYITNNYMDAPRALSMVLDKEFKTVGESGESTEFLVQLELDNRWLPAPPKKKSDSLTANPLMFEMNQSGGCALFRHYYGSFIFHSFGVDGPISGLQKKQPLTKSAQKQFSCWLHALGEMIRRQLVHFNVSCSDLETVCGSLVVDDECRGFDLIQAGSSADKLSLLRVLIAAIPLLSESRGHSVLLCNIRSDEGQSSMEYLKRTLGFPLEFLPTITGARLLESGMIDPYANFSSFISRTPPDITSMFLPGEMPSSRVHVSSWCLASFAGKRLVPVSLEDSRDLLEAYFECAKVCLAYHKGQQNNSADVLVRLMLLSAAYGRIKSELVSYRTGSSGRRTVVRVDGMKALIDKLKVDPSTCIGLPELAVAARLNGLDIGMDQVRALSPCYVEMDVLMNDTPQHHSHRVICELKTLQKNPYETLWTHLVCEDRTNYTRTTGYVYTTACFNHLNSKQGSLVSIGAWVPFAFTQKAQKTIAQFCLIDPSAEAETEGKKIILTATNIRPQNSRLPSGLTDVLQAIMKKTLTYTNALDDKIAKPCRVTESHDCFSLRLQLNLERLGEKFKLNAGPLVPKEKCSELCLEFGVGGVGRQLIRFAHPVDAADFRIKFSRKSGWIEINLKKCVWPSPTTVELIDMSLLRAVDEDEINSVKLPISLMMADEGTSVGENNNSNSNDSTNSHKPASFKSQLRSMFNLKANESRLFNFVCQNKLALTILVHRLAIYQPPSAERLVCLDASYIFLDSVKSASDVRAVAEWAGTVRERQDILCDTKAVCWFRLLIDRVYAPSIRSTSTSTVTGTTTSARNAPGMKKIPAEIRALFSRVPIFPIYSVAFRYNMPSQSEDEEDDDDCSSSDCGSSISDGYGEKCTCGRNESCNDENRVPVNNSAPPLKQQRSPSPSASPSAASADRTKINKQPSRGASNGHQNNNKPPETIVVTGAELMETVESMAKQYKQMFNGQDLSFIDDMVDSFKDQMDMEFKMVIASEIPGLLDGLKDSNDTPQAKRQSAPAPTNTNAAKVKQLNTGKSATTNAVKVKQPNVATATTAKAPAVNTGKPSVPAPTAGKVKQPNATTAIKSTVKTTKLTAAALVASITCAVCGKSPKRAFNCGRCRQVVYCGVECQKADWMRHKDRCGVADRCEVGNH